MKRPYKQLRPYLQNIQGSDHSVKAEFLAPANLLMTIGGFYKFELSDVIFEDSLIYARAWFSLSDVSYQELLSA